MKPRSPQSARLWSGVVIWSIAAACHAWLSNDFGAWFFLGLAGLCYVGANIVDAIDRRSEQA
jgi:hypothetical protein